MPTPLRPQRSQRRPFWFDFGECSEPKGEANGEHLDSVCNGQFDDGFWWTRKPTKDLQINSAITSQTETTRSIGVVALGERER
jgi:hypothetical protein